MTALGIHLTVVRTENHRSRLVGVAEFEVIDSALMRDGQTDIDGVVSYLHIVGIRRHPLLVPTGAYDGFEFCPLRYTDAESRALTMIGDHHRQPLKAFTGIVASRRVNTHQAVGQLDGGEGGYQEVAYITYIWVDIIYALKFSAPHSCGSTHHCSHEGCSHSSSHKHQYG